MSDGEKNEKCTDKIIQIYYNKKQIEFLEKINRLIKYRLREREREKKKRKTNTNDLRLGKVQIKFSLQYKFSQASKMSLGIQLSALKMP